MSVVVEEDALILGGAAQRLGEFLHVVNGRVEAMFVLGLEGSGGREEEVGLEAATAHIDFEEF